MSVSEIQNALGQTIFLIIMICVVAVFFFEGTAVMRILIYICAPVVVLCALAAIWIGVIL